MKYLILLFGLIAFYGYSQDYQLADENSDANMLAEFIQISIAENKLKEKPVIVVNEKILKESELNKLNFYKSEILGISIIVKDNVQLIDFYGEQSLNGVILIETKPFQERTVRTINDSKVLYLLNNKPITESEFAKINVDNVKSVEVIKNETEIAKYTSEKVEGVIIITMKKSE